MAPLGQNGPEQVQQGRQIRGPARHHAFNSGRGEPPSTRSATCGIELAFRGSISARLKRGSIDMQITAAVVRERSAPFVIETLELSDPRPDEVRVRIVAAGMCHTDLHGRDGYFPTMPYPAVFGHEGAGVIEAVGSEVPNVAVGDHVIISFPWCGRCPNCRRQMPSHCLDSAKLKTSGMRPDGSM